MAMDFCEITLTDRPIRVPESAPNPRAGAVVDFLGVVRDAEAGRPLDAIRYEFHPRMTEPELNRIAQEAADAYPISGLHLVHRTGVVRAGEPSLFVRVTARHRAEAFNACRWIIEQLKQRVPIWKRPVFAVVSFTPDVPAG
jgi:molybdopterin synthase catalytic subunit